MLRIFLFILGLLTVLPSACAGSKYYTCGTESNVTLTSDAAAGQMQYGAASALQAGLSYPWPEVEHKGRKLRVVTYCYSTLEQRNWLDCTVREAIQRWKDKLNSPPFKGTTNLAWQELHDGGPDPLKRQPRPCFRADAHWDVDNVPGDTLWIHIDQDADDGGRATVGYVPPADAAEKAYQHMKLGPEVTVDVLTHELGHVLGMTHEHQRSDRDDYVLFECKNLRRYTETLARVRSDYRLTYEEAHRRLCEDVKIAKKYNFGSSDYIKNPYGKVHDEPSLPFDINSVMIYSSGAYATPMCARDTNSCPLVAYDMINGRPDKKARKFIHSNARPSDEDARFIQKWYPRVP